MGHSIKNYVSFDRMGLAYIYKSKRGRRGVIGRHRRHAYRQQSKVFDQLHHFSFKRDNRYKKAYKHRAQKTGYLYGTKYAIEDHLPDRYTTSNCREMSERGRLQHQIRPLLKKDCYTNYRMSRGSVRRKSDLLIAAHKQLKRRGEMKPFRGHRDPKQLYKKQLFY